MLLLLRHDPEGGRGKGKMRSSPRASRTLPQRLWYVRSCSGSASALQRRSTMKTYCGALRPVRDAVSTLQR